MTMMMMKRKQFFSHHDYTAVLTWLVQRNSFRLCTLSPTAQNIHANDGYSIFSCAAVKNNRHCMNQVKTMEQWPSAREYWVIFWLCSVMCSDYNCNCLNCGANRRREIWDSIGHFRISTNNGTFHSSENMIFTLAKVAEHFEYLTSMHESEALLFSFSKRNKKKFSRERRKLQRPTFQIVCWSSENFR